MIRLRPNFSVWLLLLFFFACGSPLTHGADYPPSLTPPSPHTPLIHGAKVFGAHPGHPFLFTIPATGDRPMTFSADNLPDGLTLSATTGQITGTAPKAGDYPVTLRARNAQGSTSRPLLIKAGNTIGLTPPMGWNSWNCYAFTVDDGKIRAAADAMVTSGLINHGWNYVNIDDYWTVNPIKGKKDPTLAGPERNPDGTLRPNGRFPDMKALAGYIHARGLKAGLYSSPGPYTCGGCTGSYQHEEQDARTFAAWGYDHLKYDWCTYGQIYKKEGGGLAGQERPYQVMGAALAKVPRDIFFSFCQYGMGDVWKWGAEAGGNSWKTNNDIRNSWASMLHNGLRQADIGSYAGPGHWNDPDGLIVGRMGLTTITFKKMFDLGLPFEVLPTSLTPDEQYTHVSLWCLQAAPLLLGCDLTRLDPFTLGLLTNDEVIDVDQDSLGTAAHVVHPTTTGQTSVQIWARPLEDGSMAVGLINIGIAPVQATVNWGDLQLTGPHRVRDLWRQKDLGSFSSQFGGEVLPHGILLVRISKP